jgi:hypothetical protein
MRLKTLAASLVAIAISTSGCSKTPPAMVDLEGTVQLNHKPLRSVEVRFIPVNESDAEYVASGVTDDSGKFRLQCVGKPGACVGEHRVLVTEGPIPPRLRGESAQAELAKYFVQLGGRPLPYKYTTLIDSPLRINVLPDQTAYVVDLTP